MTTNERLPTKTIVIDSHFHRGCCDMRHDMWHWIITAYRLSEKRSIFADEM